MKYKSVYTSVNSTDLNTDAHAGQLNTTQEHRDVAVGVGFGFHILEFSGSNLDPKAGVMTDNFVEIWHLFRPLAFQIIF